MLGVQLQALFFGEPEVRAYKKVGEVSGAPRGEQVVVTTINGPWVGNGIAQMETFLRSIGRPYQLVTAVHPAGRVEVGVFSFTND
jgi:hypothetical protein